MLIDWKSAGRGGKRGLLQNTTPHVQQQNQQPSAVTLTLSVEPGQEPYLCRIAPTTRPIDGPGKASLAPQHITARYTHPTPDRA